MPNTRLSSQNLIDVSRQARRQYVDRRGVVTMVNEGATTAVLPETLERMRRGNFVGRDLMTERERVAAHQAAIDAERLELHRLKNRANQIESETASYRKNLEEKRKQHNRTQQLLKIEEDKLEKTKEKLRATESRNAAPVGVDFNEALPSTPAMDAAFDMVGGVLRGAYTMANDAWNSLPSMTNVASTSADQILDVASHARHAISAVFRDNVRNTASQQFATRDDVQAAVNNILHNMSVLEQTIQADLERETGVTPEFVRAEIDHASNSLQAMFERNQQLLGGDIRDIRASTSAQLDVLHNRISVNENMAKRALHATQNLQTQLEANDSIVRRTHNALADEVQEKNDVLERSVRSVHGRFDDLERGVDDRFSQVSRETQGMRVSNLNMYGDVVGRQNELERGVQKVRDNMERNRVQNNNRFDRIGQDVQHVSQSVEMMQRQLRDTRHEMSQVEDRQDAFEQDVRMTTGRHEAQLGDIETSIWGMQNAMDMNMDDLHDRVTSTDEQVTRAVQSLHTRGDAVDNNVSVVNARVDAVRAELSDTRRDMRIAVDVFGEQIQAQTERVDDLSQQMEGLHGKIDAAMAIPRPHSPPPPSPPHPVITNSPKLKAKRTLLVIKDVREPSQLNYFNNIQILQDKPQRNPPLPDISGHKKRRRKRAPKSKVFKRHKR